MPDLPEHSSPKAARILAAAGELLLARGSKGVTISDVATRAHIGKGTVYLYWKTKEDLLLGLISRDFIGLADAVTEAVTADSDLARPSRLIPRMLTTAARHPFVDALRRGDDGLLGALTEDPRAAKLLETLSPDAMMSGVLPIWRRHALARTDWPLAEQALALHALLTGFMAAPVPSRFRPEPVVPEQVLAKSVTALLGPERATPAQVRATAAEGSQALAEARETALELISAPVSAG
ncbi:TetR/AcrR family transcriptional regulator [Amycolatopsis sp. CA-126428]|uniref:TetR/AcrR family transcriptional regulator n=1 Tax=Amycolatopsis sp. CA-126428 TaxID=2073158 RepID=UPI000CD2ABA1|nr:TetR/AcrR family transcriptional regulator [Amycolatopsis sp. CA-126428]